MQTPSWQDISNNYSTEDGPQESRAVVCDINKEMLNVGKQKADSMGVGAGTFFDCKNASSAQTKICSLLFFYSTQRF